MAAATLLCAASLGDMPKLLTIVPVIAALSIAGCSSSSEPDAATSPGSPAASNGQVADFSEMDVSSAFQVTLSVGDSPSLQVTASPDVQDKVRAEVKDGTLYLGLTGRVTNVTSKIQADVVATSDLDKISISGASELTADQIAENLELNVSGGSVVDTGIGGELDATITGASTVKLNGSSSDMEAVVSGASTLSAFDLAATKADLTVSGASKAEVNASESLTVDASGASTVTYRGDAQVDETSSGASTVTKG